MGEELERIIAIHERTASTETKVDQLNDTVKHLIDTNTEQHKLTNSAIQTLVGQSIPEGNKRLVKVETDIKTAKRAGSWLGAVAMGALAAYKYFGDKLHS